MGKAFGVRAGGYVGGLIRTAMRAADILLDRAWQPDYVHVPLIVPTLVLLAAGRPRLVAVITWEYGPCGPMASDVPHDVGYGPSARPRP